MESKSKTTRPEAGRLRLVFDGGLASNGSLLLEEYSASLAGWQQFFKLTGEMYLRSFTDGPRPPGDDLLTIEIEAERPGSYEVIIGFVLAAAAGGVIGNRVDGMLVWSCKRLFSWYKRVAESHVSVKGRTTNIDALVAALQQMADAEGVQLSNPEQVAFVDNGQLTFAAEDNEQDEQSEEVQTPPENPTRVTIENIDKSLELATRPLERSCSQLSVIEENGGPLLFIGSAERSVLAAPLSLPPPTGDWQQATVKFVRINRKTGKALFYFASDLRGEDNAHYCKIVDRAISTRGNVYTSAFNDDRSLNVYIRHGRAERGHLALLWEITVKPPEPLLPYPT